MKKTMLLAFLMGSLTIAGVAYAASNHIALSDVDPIHNPSAEARVKVNDKSDGTHVFTARVSVENLPTDDGTVYEGWLVDDVGTGYKLSLGAFTTNHNGKETFHFRQRMVNPMLYDKLVITREPINDTDPNPLTPVLVGDLDF